METSTEYNRYAALEALVAKAHPSFKPEKVQKKASEIWKTVKSDPTKYKVAMASLEKSIADQNVKRMSMWFRSFRRLLKDPPQQLSQRVQQQRVKDQQKVQQPQSVNLFMKHGLQV